MQLHQKLSKAAYEAKIKGSGHERDIYFYSREIEDEMHEVFEDFVDYISSGDYDEDMKDYPEADRGNGEMKKEN